MTNDGPDPEQPAGTAPSDRGRIDPLQQLRAARDALGAPIAPDRGAALDGDSVSPTVPPLVWEHVVPGASAGGGAPVTDATDLGEPVFADDVTSDRDPTPAVEAELDRLAFLPDDVAADAASGPGQLPAPSSTPAPTVPPAGSSLGSLIEPTSEPTSEPAPGGSASLPGTSPMPTLPTPTLPERATAVSPSQAGSMPDGSTRSSRVAPNVGTAQRGAPISFADVAADVRRRPKKRRRVRRFVSRLVSMVVVLGLLGGGLLAARRFLLEPQWANDVEPLALEVAAERGLDFTASVPVVELSPVQYPAALAETMLGLDPSTIDATAGEWRALGLLDGVLDPGAIGLSATPDSPAFYDPATGSVNVLSTMGAELRTFAVQRALALALLDQHFDWSTRMADQPVAVRAGTRALYEADALATALALVIEPERLAISDQMLDLYTALEVPPPASPYASSIISRLGVALWPWFRDRDSVDRSRLLVGTAIADGTAFSMRAFAAFVDGRSSVDPDAVGAASRVTDAQRIDTPSRGALYWYHVLAARVDDDLAWRTAVGWAGDRVATTGSAGAVCVTAVFEADAASAATATDAFTQWSALSPLPVTLLVTDRAADPSTGASTGVQVSIEVCDPGTRVATNDGASRLSLGGAPLRVEQLRRLLDTNDGLSLSVAACLVDAGDAISLADERGVLDPIDGWDAPDGHAAFDLANPACAAAA